MFRQGSIQFWWVALVFLGCQDPPSSTSDHPEKDPPAQGVTYHKDVRPLVEAHCASCHEDGGIGPFVLDSYSTVSERAAAIHDAVQAGTMPPWQPDPDCRRYQDERILTPDERMVFSEWLAGGLKEGDPQDYRPLSTAQGLTPEELGPPSLQLTLSEPYTPNPELPDDYRCFVLDHEFQEETFLRTSNVHPDRSALVHHVILFLVSGQFASQLERLDQDDPGPGYTCFGGVGAGTPQPIAGWVPGSAVARGSDMAGIRIPPGAKIVMQIHYNTLTTVPEPDQSSIEFWFLEQQPPNLLQAFFFPYLGLDIQPGDADSYQTRDFINRGPEPWTIVSTSPHMHLLGKRFKTTKVAEDGTEECLVDIKDWDFNWQQGYGLLPDDVMVVAPGERLRMECWYDNSASNQPVVNGVQLEPGQVGWGEGTLDEMCLNSLVMVEPYSPLPEPGALCTSFQPCYDSCMNAGFFPQTGCILQCSGDQSCAQCVVGGVVSCASDTCGVEASAMLTCFEDCGEEGAGCIRERCTSSILTFDACAAPQMAQGACDMSVQGCGVQL